MDVPFKVLAGAGFVGSLLMALSSFWVACTPNYFRRQPPGIVSLLQPNSVAASDAFWIGLVLLLLAWLMIGHQLLEGVVVPARQIRNAATLWIAPFALAMPMASRDAWAYAAQGNIATQGQNPYTVSPLQLLGPFTDNVTPRWQGVKSPYGPLWTWMNRGVNELTGTHLVATVLILRLLTVLGFVMLAATVATLARRLGGRPSLAVWAVLANPLTVLHLVGGAHNDLLMLGLMSLAMLAATNAGSRWQLLLGAGALAGLAAAIKLPAIVAVPFLPLLGVHTRFTMQSVRSRADLRDGLPELAGGVALAGAGAAAALAVTTWLAGYGLSWTDNLNSAGHGGGAAGAVSILVVLAVTWSLALRWPPAPMLAVAFAAVVLITPSALPWYWTWVFAVAGCVITRRSSVYLLAGWTITLLASVKPNGLTTHLRIDLSVAIAALLTWAVLDRRWHPFDAERRSVPTQRQDASPSQSL